MSSWHQVRSIQRNVRMGGKSDGPSADGMGQSFLHTNCILTFPVNSNDTLHRLHLSSIVARAKYDTISSDTDRRFHSISVADCSDAGVSCFFWFALSTHISKRCSHK